MRVDDIFGDLPTVPTSRLLLRKLRIEDIDALYDYASDPEVSRHTFWTTHRNSAETKAYIKTVLDHYARKEVAVWAIERQQDGVCIGTGGFINWSPKHRRAEIGYALARDHWNQGYGTEAVRAMIRFGFETMQCNRIQAQCVPANKASSRVMEKAGMRYEGTLRDYVYIKDAYQDIEMYAILRDDWNP
jgi:ribosomal-protein-alanine N-acetyltransferase